MPVPELCRTVVLASTVHAWYLTWLLPLLAVHLAGSKRFPFVTPWMGLAWLVFSGLVALPYLTHDTHEWRLWISFAQYVPFFALAALAAAPRLAPRLAPLRR